MELRRYIKIGLFGFISFLSACTLVWTNPNWNIEGIERSLGVEIPSDAQDITYSGYAPHGGYLDLRFEATPQSVMTFAKHFCDGQIIQGFDPFNATIVDKSVPNSHPINMGYYVYYALSKNTKSSLYGIRCPFFRLVVDQSKKDTYSIHLLQEFHHHDPEELPAEYTGTPFWVPAK
jgi:hypothetical protein